MEVGPWVVKLPKCTCRNYLSPEYLRIDRLVNLDDCKPETFQARFRPTLTSRFCRCHDLLETKFREPLELLWKDRTSFSAVRLE